MEAQILSEIRDSEKKAEDIIERAKREKEAILHKAAVDSSRLLAASGEEIGKLQEKKLMQVREKSKLMREEKLAEGKTLAKQLKARSEKNVPKAVDFVMKRFEEMI